MSQKLNPYEYGRTLSSYALAFTFGLVLMGWPVITAWQYAYMQVNPTIDAGAVSIAGILFSLVSFTLGSVTVFVTVMSVLYKISLDTR